MLVTFVFPQTTAAPSINRRYNTIRRACIIRYYVIIAPHASTTPSFSAALGETFLQSCLQERLCAKQYWEPPQVHRRIEWHLVPFVLLIAGRLAKCWCIVWLPQRLASPPHPPSHANKCRRPDRPHPPPCFARLPVSPTPTPFPRHSCPRQIRRQVTKCRV